MNLKLRHAEAATAEPNTVTTRAAAEASPSIGGWLGVFATMLPRRQAESIREELETHLRDRVRDLMVSGQNEAESTKRAIAELGEAAELAGKYRALQSEPRRRIIMYGSIFAVAGAALALSISALSGGRQPEAELVKARAENEAVRNLLVDTLTRVQPEQGKGVTLDMAVRRNLQFPTQLVLQPRLRVFDVLANREAGLTTQPDSLFKADINFENAQASEVIKFLETQTGMPVSVNWKQLLEVGLEPKTPVNCRAKDAGVDVLLRALNEATGVTGEGPIDWRVTNGVLEVGSRDRFDKREVKLVIYELDGIIAARSEKYGEERPKVVEEVCKLVTEFVYPNGWRENGGELAKMTVVGDRMFVEAPERFHKQIKWMLEQLPGEKAHAAADEEMGVRQYVIKHISADEALNALKHNQAIKAIDFSNFAMDANRNAVIGKATPSQHALVAAVLSQIDTEEAAVTHRRSERDAKQNDPQLAKLMRIIENRSKLEQDLKTPGLPAEKSTELGEMLKTLQVQEEELRKQMNDAAAARWDAGDKGAAQAAGVASQTQVYLTGSVARPGVYALCEGMTLRRLLAAAGGFPAGATEVVVSDSENGQAVVKQTLKATDLSAADGPDPVIKPGQLVSVK